jgi:hypothetical protein
MSTAQLKALLAGSGDRSDLTLIYKGFDKKKRKPTTTTLASSSSGRNTKSASQAHRSLNKIKKYQ